MILRCPAASDVRSTAASSAAVRLPCFVSHGFDRRPYLRLRVKAYVFDHWYEPRMQSDITARVQEQLRRNGWLQVWPGA